MTTEEEVDSGLFQDVLIREGTAILELLAAEGGAVNQVDTHLVVDLSLDIVDCVRRFDLESDGLANQCLHKGLHSAATTEEVDSGLVLDVVIRESTAILELLAIKGSTVNQVDTHLVMDLSLDIVDHVQQFDLE